MSINKLLFKYFYPFPFVSNATLKSATKSCQSCKFYHGKTYGGVLLNCSVHPSGIDDDYCSDYLKNNDWVFSKEKMLRFKKLLDLCLIKLDINSKNNAIQYYYSLDSSDRPYCHFVLSAYLKHYQHAVALFAFWCIASSLGSMILPTNIFTVLIIFTALIFDTVCFLLLYQGYKYLLEFKDYIPEIW